MRLNRAAKAGLAMAMAMMVGCGGAAYEARMQKTVGDLKSGRVAAVGTAGTAAAPAPTSDARLFASPYTIYDSAGTKTGVTIYLPKEFVNADGSANFTNSDTFGGQRLTEPGVQTSIMAYYYADPSGKKYPAIITFSRLPRPAGAPPGTAEQNKAVEAAALAAASQGMAPGSPPLAMSDFPTASGNWRKLTSNKPLAVPVGDQNGAKELVDCRTDQYSLMTTEERVIFNVTAPTSVTNTFDFFGAVEAGLRAMQAGPPTVTGTIP
jgi:hypothetical protein